MRSLAIIIALVLLPLVAFATEQQSLQSLVIKHALKYEGITEATNHNDGPEVEQVLGYVGLPKGQPYCVAFVIYMYHLAAKELGMKDVLPPIPRASLMLYACKRNPIKYRIITPNQIALGIFKAEEGDITIHRRGAAVYNFTGHGGLVITQLTKAKYESIEGNTQSSNKGDQGEGGGFFRKQRPFISRTFPVVGIIRLRHTGD